ncbi:hypothetical protein SAMN05428961_11092 [Paenibacillus sp. OK060]|nr:hypothetical protein SAMN05428961_11092 [Paenibacillus sp. OK060]
MVVYEYGKLIKRFDRNDFSWTLSYFINGEELQKDFDDSSKFLDVLNSLGK